MTAKNDKSSRQFKLWNSALLCSLILGLALGFALRAWAAPWLPLVVGLLGYASGIVAIGTSNIFQADPNKHYEVNTQRVLTCISALALSASILTLFP